MNRRGVSRRESLMARIGNLIRDPEELKQRSVELDTLASMLDRITKDDVRRAAQALLDSAHDIAYLLSGKHKPVACPCRLIENDNNGTCYLVYDDACMHHRHLKHEEERLKAAYANAEKQLKDSVRLQLIKAALPGLGYAVNTPSTAVATRAIEIADAVLAELLK
jgi:hypothetical protein